MTLAVIIMPLKTDLENYNIQVLTATQKLHLQLQLLTYVTYASNIHAMHLTVRQSRWALVTPIRGLSQVIFLENKKLSYHLETGRQQRISL